MKKFIYVFSEEDKKELLLSGFSYVCEYNIGGKKAFIFQGDCKKLNFALDKNKYIVDDKFQLFF